MLDIKLLSHNAPIHTKYIDLHTQNALKKSYLQLQELNPRLYEKLIKCTCFYNKSKGFYSTIT